MSDVYLVGGVRTLVREGGRRGLATLCVGVGQGVALVIEAV